MKIVAINSLPNGSPATIMRGILNTAENYLGAEVFSFYGNWKKCPSSYKGSIRFGFRIENYLSSLFQKCTGIANHGSVFGTIQLIRRIKRISPDIVHLHNLHLSVINIPILFSYLKKHNIKVIWTLHDCWAFTGRCPHFQVAGCEKWRNQCRECPYPKTSYPQAFIDKTSYMFLKKKKWFCGIKNMIIVTPSIWLSSLVKKSFLSGYPIKVINNGIDLNIFKPTKSLFRKNNGIQNNKKIILGVAFEWGPRKGLDVFIDLANKLDDNYKIVMVGVDNIVCKTLPDQILTIPKTDSQIELAQIYSAADVFFNPTREDNYPTVNMEAIACGTPVITFNTGGSPEIVSDGTGFVIDVNDCVSAVNCISELCQQRNAYFKSCIFHAANFDMKTKYVEYVKLYEEAINEYSC